LGQPSIANWLISTAPSAAGVRSSVGPDVPWTPSETIPVWSPLRPDAPVPWPLDTLFPRAYFDDLRAAPPSLTMMRHFNEKVARLRQRGLAPDWMPDQRFAPLDMSHLLALAFCQGPSGGLDLADIISDMPKLLKRLARAVFDAGDRLKEADGDNGLFKGIVLLAATSVMGLRAVSERMESWEGFPNRL